jgi:DNA-binding response OmpR family regulator
VQLSPPLLIVEDDELVRSFLSRALTDVAGDVNAVATGAEAMRAVQRHRYGAILLDGLLPDTHGVDLGRRLVAGPNATHSGICFVSGSLRQALPLRSGVSALPKPLRLRELIAAVEELLVWGRTAGAAVADRLAALDSLAADLLVG